VVIISKEPIANSIDYLIKKFNDLKDGSKILIYPYRVRLLGGGPEPENTYLNQLDVRLLLDLLVKKKLILYLVDDKDPYERKPNPK